MPNKVWSEYGEYLILNIPLEAERAIWRDMSRAGFDDLLNRILADVIMSDYTFLGRQEFERRWKFLGDKFRRKIAVRGFVDVYDFLHQCLRQQEDCNSFDPNGPIHFNELTTQFYGRALQLGLEPSEQSTRTYLAPTKSQSPGNYSGRRNVYSATPGNFVLFGPSASTETS